MIVKHSNIGILRELPSAILLDTDNTLYEYDPANRAALNATYKKLSHKFGINKKDFTKYYGKARDDVKLRLGSTASSHSRLLYFQRMFELLECNSQLLLSLDLEQTFWRNFLANAPLFENLDEFLRLSKSLKIKLAIITDLTSHIQLRKLTHFNLESFFDAVVCSEEVGADKPDQRNFELCFQKLNLQSNDKVWMIGDNPYSDIHGGNLAKCITFQIVHGRYTVKKEVATPDFSFRHYADLISFLKSISNQDITL